MQQIVTPGIVLSRTDFGEADRIITVITPEGKLSLLAKGSRKIKSRLAGGIELFTINDYVYIQGRGEIQTLRGASMRKSFSNIVKNLDRTQAGYVMIRLVNKQTERQCESDYFKVLEIALDSLNDDSISL